MPILTQAPVAARTPRTKLSQLIPLAEPAEGKLLVIHHDDEGETILNVWLGNNRNLILKLDLAAAHSLQQALAFLPALPAMPAAPLVQPGQFSKPAAPSARVSKIGGAS